MQVQPSSVASPFASFIDRWIAIEPLIYERADDLEAGHATEGTLEDLGNLLRVVDGVLQCVALGIAPSASCVPYACAFALTWSQGDELAERIRSLVGAYEEALARVFADPHDRDSLPEQDEAVSDTASRSQLPLQPSGNGAC